MPITLPARTGLVTYPTWDVERGIGLEMLESLLSVASATWPTANRAFLYPCYLDRPVTIAQFFVHNGATASGNLDIGLYTEGFARVISSGSTAQSGTSALQVIDVTDTTVRPGRYYLGVVMDNTTGTMVRANQNGQWLKPAGVLQMDTAFALPATFTPASMTQSFVPLAGFTTTTVL